MRPSLSFVWNLLYPSRCAACGHSGEWLCSVCLEQCIPHGFPCCSRCGSRILGLTCTTCERYIRHLDELCAAYSYSGPVRDLVHRFKYDGMSAAAGWMAERMPVAWLPRDAVFVPVPLHPARKRERGYNQSELLARALGKRTGHPVVPALKRVRHTAPQAHMGAAGRWANIKGAFEPRRKLDSGSAVVLIDDVCTTGATMEECAKVMSGIGAERVAALVFART